MTYPSESSHNLPLMLVSGGARDSRVDGDEIERLVCLVPRHLVGRRDVVGAAGRKVSHALLGFSDMTQGPLVKIAPARRRG